MSMPILGRMAVGAGVGGYMGHRYGDTTSDGSATGKLTGTITGALGGALVGGLGTTALRKGIQRYGNKGVREAFKGPSAANALLGLGGVAAGAGAGYGSAALAHDAKPGLYQENYAVQQEKKEKAELTQLKAQLQMVGNDMSKISPRDQERLRLLYAKYNTVKTAAYHPYYMMQQRAL